MVGLFNDVHQNYVMNAIVMAEICISLQKCVYPYSIQSKKLQHSL